LLRGKTTEKNQLEIIQDLTAASEATSAAKTPFCICFLISMRPFNPGLLLKNPSSNEIIIPTVMRTVLLLLSTTFYEFLITNYNNLFLAYMVNELGILPIDDVE
jgi:hypothetical protein